MPRKYDENRETAAVFSPKSFYRQQFKMTLDTLVVMMTDNLSACLETLKPLAETLATPLQRSNMELHKVEELIALFPPSVPRPDSSALLAELEILADNCPGGTIAEVLKISEQLKKVLPMANHAVRLICTSPVTVAANERTFSKLKIIKSVLRSTMTDSRLDALLLLSCEKDIVDNLNLTSVVKKWSLLKTRRVQF